MIGFYDLPIRVEQNVDLSIVEMYLPQQSMIFLGEESSFGKISTYFNQEPVDIQYQLEGNPPEILHEEIILDSLILWYADTSKIDWSIIFSFDTTTIDTLVFTGSNINKPLTLSGELVPGSSRNNKTIKPDTNLVINGIILYWKLIRAN